MSSSAISPQIQLRDEMIRDLTQNILPYWMTKMPDENQGGFYGRRDGFDVLDEKADKGIILNTRILWTFSHAVNTFSPAQHIEQSTLEAYRKTADRAYEFIVHHFLDQEKGGVYWMVSYEGKPVNMRKQIYAQAFCIYALSEYYLATKKKEVLDLAIALFQLIEKYSFDRVDNGYLEAFDRNWNVIEDLRLSDKDANEKKTMNTHLHVLEAYTNLFRCWKDETLRNQLRNLIIVFRDRIIDNEFHFQLFFDEHWNVKPHVISYGHDIEGSWLLYEAAEVLGEKVLMDEIKVISLAMVDTAIREGMDSDGGLMYEGINGKVCNGDKHWWPQAEAIVGCISAWQLSGDKRYFEAAQKTWRFIQQKLIDHEQGEWHWRVSQDGTVCREEDKAGPWKCPYHNGRTAMEMLRRLK